MWYTIRKIKKAKPAQLDEIQQAVISRYAELYPDWEITTVSVEKTSDHTEQLDQMIASLESMKKNI